MEKTVQKKLAKGIWLCNGSVMFRKMIDGKRIMRKAGIQGVLALDSRGRPTKQLMKEYNNWVSSRINDPFMQETKRDKVPTFGELMDLYRNAAEEEQIKSDGRPTDRTISNALKHFKYTVEGCGFKWDEKYDRMTVEALEDFYVKLRKEGKKVVTAWTYIAGVQSITPKWALPYYKKAGYIVNQIQVPVIKKKKSERYTSPSEQTKENIKKWYAEKWESKDKRFWLASTMVLQFAMRNGDVINLKWSDFQKRENGVYLVYTPHKTERSSGRRVMWPIHPQLWQQMQEARKLTAEDPFDDDEFVIPAGTWTMARLNVDLRSCVPAMRETNKAVYELRKLRIHAEYVKHGAERASALSGDDIKTLSYYYADVSDVEQTPEMIETLIM